MKKIITGTLFLTATFFYQVQANDKNAESNEINFINFDECTSSNSFDGCMNYYTVTKIDCAGSATTVNLGGNRGDCSGHQDGDILYHNSTFNACNGKAVATSVISVLAIAATIASVL